MNLDPFKQIAAAMRSRNGFDATLLLFKKGLWTAGKDASAMDGVELAALVNELMTGWAKWEDKRPADYVVGRVADGFKPPKRNQLGDTDRSLWDFDKDPWQFGFYLPLADPKSGQLYVYQTSSHGGKNAIANLLDTYTDFCEREGTDKVPLISLASDHYAHQEFGRVNVPMLDISGWIDPPANIKQIRPPASATPLLAAPQGGQPLAVATQGGDFNDEIPF
jgi:hypothetical protein